MYLRTPLLLILALAATSMAMRCPPGTFRINNKCRPCPPGTYSEDANSRTCSKCPPGTFNPYEGAPDSDMCRSCHENTFNSRKAAATCRPCPKGTVSRRGASMCLACGPGTEVDHSSRRCVPCERGSFSTGKANLRCQYCPFPLTGPRGSDSVKKCVPCPPGKAGSSCSACLDGRFKSGREGFCEECPSGSVSKEGATKCTRCGPGKFALFGRKRRSFIWHCAACPKGYTSQKGASMCRKIGKPCPDDTFETANGNCEKCKPGYFLNERRKICEKCAPGFASEGGLQPSCTECKGELLPDDSSMFCRCPQGRYVQDDGTCAPCPAGTGGNYVNEELFGIEGCILCGYGTFSDKPGSEVCTPCPFGTVAAKEGATDCTKCPEGTVPNSDESQEGSNCVTLKTGCPLGYKNQHFWGAFCQRIPCTPGTPKSELGVSCIPCESGEFLDNKNRCKQCSFDEFSLGGVVRSCTKCPDGRVRNYFDGSRCSCNGVSRKFNISSGNGLSNGMCRPCPPGSFSKANTFMEVDNKDLCSLCPPGTFTDKPGSGVCERCPKNTFSDNAGSTACKGCPDGTVGNLFLGSVKCVTA